MREIVHLDYYEVKKKTENHKKITVFNEHFSVNSHRYR